MLQTNLDTLIFIQYLTMYVVSYHRFQNTDPGLKEILNQTKMCRNLCLCTCKSDIGIDVFNIL
jgi:hypothetical protein